ncbi:MAG TPA: HAD family hydrolase [bacterium]|nr:HAD family hydrolase [bacterium]
MTRDPRFPAGLLCDMDDTILDSSGARERCLRQVCVEAAVGGSGLDPEALAGAIDRMAVWFWGDPRRHRRGRMDLQAAFQEIMRAALLELGIDRSDLAHAVADRYRALREEHYRVFPGAIETLVRLRARGVRVALVTNGTAHDQRKKIERFGLARYVDGIFIEGELGVGKPHPRVFEQALAALACPPGDAWSIGDNLEWDVVGPQRLGVFGIWVDAGGLGPPPGSPARPDRIVRSITELV